MKFTVAIIGRNESDVILRCLKSVLNADEILYMDTGSTDDTLKQVRKYKGKNLRVLPSYKWRDDFSHARNTCTQQAKNEWVLTIDCDEQLAKGGVGIIERELDNNASMPGFNGLKLSVVLPNETTNQLRVHRRNNMWRRPAHNMLSTIKGFIPIALSIEAGTGSSHMYDPDMRRRIISNYLENENPTDAEMWYYLGREYMKKGDLNRAIDNYLNMKRFTYLSYTDLYVDGLFLLSQCYYVMNKIDEARIVLGEVVSLNPNYRGAVELLARINYNWTGILNKIDNKNVLISRRPISLMDNRSIVKRVAQVATIPEHEGGLRKMLDSVVPYVDTVYVMLNNYSRIPSWMKDMDRVVPVMRKNEKGDAEKFFDVEKRVGCMIYILDDDIIYNETFFNVCHDNSIRQRIPVGFQGKIMKKNVESFYKGIVLAIDCLKDSSSYHQVNIIGTGCLCFTLDDCNISYADFKGDGISDIWFSAFCKNNKIALMTLPHVSLEYNKPLKGTMIREAVTKTEEITLLYKKLFEETKK